MNTDMVNSTATFVMAHWRKDNSESRLHLEAALEGIYKQTDSDWQLVIVDDASPCADAGRYLEKIKALKPGKINIILMDENKGPGFCRNAGIMWAYNIRSPIILFNDADDISHPKRLETVRKIFTGDKDARVVYSTFKVIDETGRPVEESRLTKSILEILEGHRENPVQGEKPWIRIGTEKGYTNLTSSTAVRTETAYKYPFPDERVSEDQHAWLRYCADGGKFIYAKDIPSLYRIPQGTPTVSRARIIGYYAEKAEVDTRGFLEAIDIACNNGKIQRKDAELLLVKFYIKLGETLAKENEYGLAAEQVAKAASISVEKTREDIAKRGLGKHSWAIV